MKDMPILGEPPRKSPVAPVALTAVVVGLLSGVAYWWTHRAPAPDAAPAAPPPQATAEAPAAPPVEPTAVAPAAPGAPTAQPALPVAPPADGLQTLTVTIDGPLESAIIAAAGKEVGAPLTQVVTRALVWWVRVPQDLVRNDGLSVVYETRPGQEPLVHAVRFTSRKLGKTVEAYRYQPKSSAFARFFQPDGTELEERLLDSPLDSYEQITSLLRDGRRHKGVDFKTPAGTPVRATFDGTITRKNWNFRGNGNSLEIEEAGGQHRTALYLHLSELPKSVQPGQRVKKGEVIAQSGNSGHSFAPHLHYQLMRGDQVLDPFDSHRTTRAALPTAERPLFEAAMNGLRARLTAETVAAAGR
ncbi:MAG: M23 family metallopeptidase [Myxococcota bacterium]